MPSSRKSINEENMENRRFSETAFVIAETGSFFSHCILGQVSFRLFRFSLNRYYAWPTSAVRPRLSPRAVAGRAVSNVFGVRRLLHAVDDARAHALRGMAAIIFFSRSMLRFTVAVLPYYTPSSCFYVCDCR